MAAILHIIFLCVSVLLHHTSYGTEIHQEFEPEQQVYKDTSSLDFPNTDEDSTKPMRIKNNFESNRQINDREKFRGINFKPEKVINEDLKKLLQSLVVVLQDFNKTGEGSPDKQFEESSFQKMSNSLNNMQKINQIIYGGMIEKGNNEDRANIQIPDEDYERERYNGNFKQRIPPSFNPRIPNRTKLSQNNYRQSGDFVDDYINYSTIDNPRLQIQKRIGDSKFDQTRIPNSEIYRYINRSPTVKITDYEPDGSFTANIRRIRPNEPNPDFNTKQNTERYLNLDKSGGVIGHYSHPTVYNANGKNIPSNLEKQQNFREEANPKYISLKEALEIVNYPKKYTNKDNSEDYKPPRTLDANSQKINSNQPNLSNSHKEPDQNYLNEDRIGDNSSFKPTNEFNLNTQNIPFYDPKQTILNRNSTSENNQKDDGNKENITNNNQSSNINLNSQNINPNQPELFNPSSESKTKYNKFEDEINPFKPTDELNVNSIKMKTKEPKQTNSNAESTTEHNPKRNGDKEIFSNDEQSSNTNTNSQNVDPNDLKSLNTPKQLRSENYKNEDKISLSIPTEDSKIKNIESNEPKQIYPSIESMAEVYPRNRGNEENAYVIPVSLSSASSQNINPNQSQLLNHLTDSKNEKNNWNRELIAQDSPKNEGNENTNDDERSSITDSNSQSVNLNQPNLPNPPFESGTNNDQNKDEINLYNPTDELNMNTKNAVSNEPKQTYLNKEPLTEDNLNEGANEGNISNEQRNDFSTRSQIISPIQLKMLNPPIESSNEKTNSNKESSTEDNPNDTGNEKNINNNEPLSISNAKSQAIDTNQLKFTIPSTESNAKTDKNENENNLSKPTDNKYLNTKIIESNEPQQMDSIGVSVTDDSLKDDKNGGKNFNDEPLSTSSAKYQNINPSQPNLYNYSKVPTPENGQNTDKNEDEINISKPINLQYTQTNGPKLITSDENTSEGDVSSADSDYDPSDFEYEEDNSGELYDDENYDEDERTIINYQDFEDTTNSNSQLLLQNAPKVQSKNQRIKSESSPSFENNNQTKGSTALDTKFDAQIVRNMHDSEQEKDSTSFESDEDDSQGEDEETSINSLDFEDEDDENSQQNSSLSNEENPIAAERSPTFENESQTKELAAPRKKQDSEQTIPNLSNSKQNVDENFQQSQNFPTSNGKKIVKGVESPASENENQTKESINPEENLDFAQTEDSNDSERKNYQQSLNPLTPKKNSSNLNESSPTSENERQTEESSTPEGNQDLAQMVPGLLDSDEDVSESQQSKISPTPNENNPIKFGNSNASKNESQTNKSTTPGGKHKPLHNVPNSRDSKDVLSGNSKQFKNLQKKNNPLKDEGSLTSDNERQTKESSTEDNQDSAQIVPTLPDFEENVSEYSQQSEISPTPSKKNPIKYGKSTASKHESQTNKSTTPAEKRKPSHNVSNSRDSTDVLSANSQQLKNSPKENNPLKDEGSLTSEYERQTKESSTPEDNQDSAQIIPGLPDSEEDVSEYSQQLEIFPTPSEKNPIKYGNSAISKHENQTNKSTTPAEKHKPLHNVPNSRDSKDVLIANFQQLKNSPKENNQLKDKGSPTFVNKSQTNDPTTNKEEYDSSQNIPIKNAQQLQNLRTQYKSSQLNERPRNSESESDELITPGQNLISVQTVPDSRNSNRVNSGQSQQLPNPSKPNENTPKDKSSSTSKNKIQTNEPKTPGEKIYFKQTSPTFTDFEEAVMRNSQEFQNLPVQNENNFDSFSSIQNSHVNNQMTPGENIQQTVQTVPNFSDFKDINSGNSQQTSLTSKEESQTNESVMTEEKFDTILEFLQQYSKNPVYKQLKQNDGLISLIH